MRRKSMYGYKFNEQNGVCEITAKAEINPYHIERILGRAKVKGKRVEYEYVYIKSMSCDFEGVLLTERKNLNFDIVSSFITHYSNGDRTVGNHPYCDDLKDDDLLDELGITVLQYKHFYPSGSGLCICYYPCKKSEISDELKEKLREWTKNAEEQKAKYDNARKWRKEQGKLMFEPCKTVGRQRKVK